MFKGSDVWDQMNDEEILDIKDILMWFLISSIMERLFHAALEVHTFLLYGPSLDSPGISLIPEILSRVVFLFIFGQR